MPYRIDLLHAGDDALDLLIELGALDVEPVREHGIAALMPDSVTPGEIARVLCVDDVPVSPAAGRDDDSVWILRPRAVRAGRIRIVPAHVDAEPGALKLIDAAAFGTGLHPTTALCLDALDEAIQTLTPSAVLDVGTGSGVLALAALIMGAPRAMGLDIDDEALRVASENARINGMSDRLQLARGGPEAVEGTWPLVLANIVAASLIDMAPTLVQRVGHQGRLVLSGIPASLEHDVARVYVRLGMRPSTSLGTRPATSLGARPSTSLGAHWVAVVLQASW